MPTYNQLAATSLLNQQYNAALGLGIVKWTLLTSLSVMVYFCWNNVCGYFLMWICTNMYISVHTVPSFHGIPARRAPTVEQAVQTVPLASAAQKRGKSSTQLQGRQTVRPAQRSGRDGSQAQKENISTSEIKCLLTSKLLISCFFLSIPFLFNPTEIRNVFLTFNLLF